MTDKVEEKVEEKEEKVVEKKEEVVEPEYTEVEQEAMDQGWLPKDKWEESGKDGSEWRSAKEFKDRGELFNTIHQQRRELKQTQAGLEALKKHHQYVFDTAHKKALSDMKKERREAIQAEDMDRVEKIEEDMESLQEEHQKSKADLEREASVQAAQQPELVSFYGRNPWYAADAELRDEADYLGIAYVKRNPGAPPTEVLKHVETTIKKRNPEKFGGKRAAPNAVVGVDRTKTTRKTTESYHLTADEESVMNDLVANGVLTKSEYIADLRKLKGE